MGGRRARPPVPPVSGGGRPRGTARRACATAQPSAAASRGSGTGVRAGPSGRALHRTQPRRTAASHLHRSLITGVTTSPERGIRPMNRPGGPPGRCRWGARGPARRRAGGTPTTARRLKQIARPLISNERSAAGASGRTPRTCCAPYRHVKPPRFARSGGDGHRPAAALRFRPRHPGTPGLLDAAPRTGHRPPPQQRTDHEPTASRAVPSARPPDGSDRPMLSVAGNRGRPPSADRPVRRALRAARS